MSYIALATKNFDTMARFYVAVLGATVLDSWDRPRARGTRLDLHGLTMELLDNRQEAKPLDVAGNHDRIQLVLEVSDVEAVAAQSPISPRPQMINHSWGATRFRAIDPEGTTINVLQWNGAER